MSDTPRTDAQHGRWTFADDPYGEMVKFARQLERELAARPEAQAQNAARYEWIRKNALWRSGYREQSVTWDVYMQEPDIREGELTDDSVARELDAAIDNAMNNGPT